MLAKPTIRLWSHHFHAIASGEPAAPTERAIPTERAGDHAIRVRVQLGSEIATALIYAEPDATHHLTVDMPEGRFCGRVNSWTTENKSYLAIEAADLSASYASLIYPTMPVLHNPFADPGPVVVNPCEVARLADRIANAVRAANPKQGAYIGRAFDDNGESRVAHMIIDGAVDFREVAWLMLAHPED